jgi:hypothetical protein
VAGIVLADLGENLSENTLRFDLFAYVTALMEEGQRASQSAPCTTGATQRAVEFAKLEKRGGLEILGADLSPQNTAELELPNGLLEAVLVFQETTPKEEPQRQEVRVVLPGYQDIEGSLTVACGDLATVNRRVVVRQ